MSDHVHAWEPVMTHWGNYRCACGATGYRYRHGEIRPHREPRDFTTDQTVGYSIGNRNGPGGWGPRGR